MTTNISWTDETWNPVVGCNQVSPGCAHCYAKTLHDMRHKAHLAGKKMLPQYHVPFEQVQMMDERLLRPLHWKKPRKVFVNSVSDLFHEDVPFEFIDKVFAVMALAHQHIYQVLTKRPERMLEYFSNSWRWTFIEGQAHALYEQMTGLDPSMWMSVKLPLTNVWLGTSVENQHFADIRIPLLLKVPAAVHFLSCEPLLGPVSLLPWISFPDDTTDMFFILEDSYGSIQPLDWVIVGGESGRGYRPMQLEWVRDIRNDCDEAGVAFWYKQANGYRSEMNPLLDGVQHHEFPKVAA